MAVLEARHISALIQEAMEHGFCVSAPEGKRKVSYSDFCILLRSANRYAVDYFRELQRNGIPARSEISPGFFETTEIAVMLSFLRVIDNPLQDISLLSVLMSPVYGFTADDLADIRLQGRNLPLYLALVRRGEGGDKRVQGMLRDLDAYRAMAATLPSDQMLERIYEQSGYRNMVQAMEDGPRRLANLQLLSEYARKYESFGYYGISRFIHPRSTASSQPPVSHGITFPVVSHSAHGRTQPQYKLEIPALWNGEYSSPAQPARKSRWPLLRAGQNPKGRA